MAASDLVSDPSLQSILQAADHTRASSVHILETLATLQKTQPSLPPAEQSEVIKLTKTLYAQLARVRGQNRDALLQVRRTKHLTADARQEIDNLHLQLQNLFYEQQHLRGEIAACEGYKHEYRKLSLISRDEFLRLHPAHLADDEHALMVARIKNEHEQRQELENKRQELLKRKQDLLSKNNSAREALAKLDKEVEEFITASNPIVQALEKGCAGGSE